MDRRTFVKGAFGLVIVGAGAGALVSGLAGSAGEPLGGEAVFTTAAATAVDAAVGPLMRDGIEVSRASGAFLARYGETDLFSADEAGAMLVKLADGSRSIDGIAREAAASLGTTLDPADVASFFVTLGQAGYLQNTVLVNLVENPA